MDEWVSASISVSCAFGVMILFLLFVCFALLQCVSFYSINLYKRQKYNVWGGDGRELGGGEERETIIQTYYVRGKNLF